MMIKSNPQYNKKLQRWVIFLGKIYVKNVITKICNDCKQITGLL